LFENPAKMRSTVQFILDGQPVRLEFQQGRFPRPTTTLLQYLRDLPGHRGTKEGCAEGDCGACTVVLAEPDGNGGLRYRAVDSCLVLLPMVHGSQVITVEDLRDSSGSLHPVQQALVEKYGSQCGYCTPGVVMSLFALHKGTRAPAREEVIDAVAGNLCRCTGYRSIIDAGLAACGSGEHDRFAADAGAIVGQLSMIPREGLKIDTGTHRYIRPATLSEAIEARKQDPGALVICGATDVALRLTKKHEDISSILDLSGIPELRTMRAGTEGVSFGAAMTIQEALERCRSSCPPLARMLTVFGSRQIRNVATLGGNIGTASPIGDSIPVLMALKATVELTGPSGSRLLPIEAMLLGYRTTACGPDELITRIAVPPVPRDVVIQSYKISRRRDLDISSVSGAFRLRRDDAGNVTEVVIAFGGMSGKTQRATRTESFLTGRQWTREVVEEAMELLASEFTPLTDVRGTAEFRATIARNLLLKFWGETTTFSDTACVRM
jgi:xanthine dehydrogenase small subunit